MADSLVIELELKNLVSTMNGLKQLAQTTQQLGSAQSGTNNAVGQVKRLSQAYTQAAGPAQRLVKAQMDLATAMRSGTGAQKFDAQYNFQRAQTSLQKAMKSAPTFGDKAMRALSSSRINLASGDLMPLVGQMSSLLGEAAGPIGIAVTAIKLLGEAAKQTAEMLKTNAEAYYLGGGTSRENAQGQRVGGMVGMDAKAFAQAAREYQQTVNTNGYAMANANSIGNGYRGPFDSTDRMEPFLRAIKHVTSSGVSDEQAMREANANPSLQAFLSLRDLKESSKQDLFKPGGDMEQMFSPQARQDAAEYQKTMMEMNLEWQRFVMEVGRPVMEIIRDLTAEFKPYMQAAGDFAEAIRPYLPLLQMASGALIILRGELWLLKQELDFATAVLKIFSPVFQDIIAAFHDLSQGHFRAAWDDVKKIPDDFKKGFKDAQDFWGNRDHKADKQIGAMDKHTEAMNRHSESLTRPGIYGGGERAQGAMPHAYQGAGWAVEKYARSHSLMMGALTL